MNESPPRMCGITGIAYDAFRASPVDGAGLLNIRPSRQATSAAFYILVKRSYVDRWFSPNACGAGFSITALLIAAMSLLCLRWFA